MMKFVICNLKKKKGGFALLIAVVLSAIILTIGLSIVSTALKEGTLAATVRSSLSSFYIADGGVECALYWDNIRGNFEKESAFVSGTAQNTIECGGIVVNNVPNGPSVNFWLKDETNLAKSCTNVNIKSVSDGADTEKVFLQSWGFNTCDLSNSRRVDRAIEVKYFRYK